MVKNLKLFLMKICKRNKENSYFCSEANLLYFSYHKNYVQPLTQFPQLPPLQLFVSQLDKAPL